MSSSQRVYKSRDGGRSYNNKQWMHKGTKRVGVFNSVQHQHPKNVVREDYEKIINFLKARDDPQKAIIIAKACGYQNKAKINPTLYQMAKEKLIKLSNDKPPLWGLPNKITDTSTKISTSPRNNTYNRQRIPNQKLGIQSDYQRREGNKRTGVIRKFRSHEQPKCIRDNRQEPNAVVKDISYSGAKTCSQTDEVGISSTPDEGLFKRTIHDTTAPGAFRAEQLENTQENCQDTHSHQVQPISNHSIAHQQNSPNLKLHLSSPHKSSSSSTEANAPLIFGSECSEVNSHTQGDRCNEYSDDEEYDLNFRISDVMSFKDPDLLTVVGDSNATGAYVEEESNSAQGQHKELVEPFNKSESDHEEVWTENGYLGPTVQSETWKLEINRDTEKEVIDSHLLHVLNNLPMKSTVKGFLAANLNMVDSDLQTLLDTCHKAGWIDYSSFGHIRLTEAGEQLVTKCDHLVNTSKQLSTGPPPFPDQLMTTFRMYPASSQNQTITVEHPNIYKYQSNVLGSSVSKQFISQENKSMPWLPKALVTCFNPGNNLGDKNDVMDPSSSEPLSSTTGNLLQSKTLPIIPSFGNLFLTNCKASVKTMECYDMSDHLHQNQIMSCLSVASPLSQQKQSEPQRPPLLSTPDIRGSTVYSKCLLNTGKIALLPSPNQSAYQQHQQKQNQQQDTPTNLQISTESFAALNKNPISAFMEYGQCRHMPARIDVLSQKGPSHKPVFTIAAVLGNRVFPGIKSSNKKNGKKDAAEQAIRILIAEGQYNMPVNSGVMSIPESSMTQFDKIAALTHHKFNQLIARIPESLVGRKVIAGLVLKTSDADTGTVVAIGSGNRCITGDKLSLRGLTVNDCHAEIITRRGFMRFLYHQLRSYNPKKDHPLFEKSTTGKIRIKHYVSFHLYISTAPCGDGALFSPRDVESNNMVLGDSCVIHKPTFETNVQGVLRTKMEGGEGTIPVDPDKPTQTWDGIVRGERLRTMSCSDKICRWNVMGLQGALLANFLDPIYLSSITLGFLFDAGHLSRAVCCRLNRGEPSLNSSLPSPYRLNHPLLGRVTACDATRETQKTKSFSINWMVEDEKPEIVDGSQGTCYTGDKNEPSQASRLCKKCMFDHFHQTSKLLGYTEFLSATSYSLAKKVNKKYLQAKEAMIQKFKSTNCGIWLGKPEEEEMFS